MDVFSRRFLWYKIVIIFVAFVYVNEQSIYTNLCNIEKVKNTSISQILLAQELQLTIVLSKLLLATEVFFVFSVQKISLIRA